jgi:hypothetical protein
MCYLWRNQTGRSRTPPPSAVDPRSPWFEPPHAVLGPEPLAAPVGAVGGGAGADARGEAVVEGRRRSGGWVEAMRVRGPEGRLGATDEPPVVELGWDWGMGIGGEINSSSLYSRVVHVFNECGAILFMGPACKSHSLLFSSSATRRSQAACSLFFLWERPPCSPL